MVLLLSFYQLSCLSTYFLLRIWSLECNSVVQWVRSVPGTAWESRVSPSSKVVSPRLFEQISNEHWNYVSNVLGVRYARIHCAGELWEQSVHTWGKVAASGQQTLTGNHWKGATVASYHSSRMNPDWTPVTNSSCHKHLGSGFSFDFSVASWELPSPVIFPKQIWYVTHYYLVSELWPVPCWPLRSDVSCQLCPNPSFHTRTQQFHPSGFEVLPGFRTASSNFFNLWPTLGISSFTKQFNCHILCKDFSLHLQTPLLPYCPCSHWLSRALPPLLSEHRWHLSVFTSDSLCLPIRGPDT